MFAECMPSIIKKYKSNNNVFKTVLCVDINSSMNKNTKEKEKACLISYSSNINIEIKNNGNIHLDNHQKFSRNLNPHKMNTAE